MTLNLPFYSHKQCMIDRYGKALFRVPVDPGFSCPHRGADGAGGCTFCADDGVRAQQITGQVALREQIQAGVQFARERYAAEGFMAYVQSFTGTFAPHTELAGTYDRILSLFPFDAISIGTRPDCLGEEAIEVLAKLAPRLDVWVELGIQTVHDRSLRRVRRGHTWADSRAAIHRLRDAGLLVVGHVMLGLPGETREDFSETARVLAAENLAAVKIHNLHVMRDTELAAEFSRAPFPVFDEHDFLHIAIDFIRRTPPGVAVMRVNTDTPKDRLVAPHWHLSKGAFRELVITIMQRHGLQQGDLCRSPLDAPAKLGQASAP